MTARLSHVAVPVPNLAQACRFYARLVGADTVRLSGVPEIGIRNAFVAIGDKVYFELIETADGGPVRVFDDVFDHGRQMMCFECDDLPATIAQLKADGFADAVIELPENPRTPSLPFNRAWVRRSARGDFSMELVPAGAVAELYAQATVVAVDELGGDDLGGDE